MCRNPNIENVKKVKNVKNVKNVQKSKYCWKNVQESKCWWKRKILHETPFTMGSVVKSALACRQCLKESYRKQGKVRKITVK